jgi:hypothetical protein
MAEKKKKKQSYLEQPLQKLAHSLGLVSNPDAAAVRKEAYAGYTPKKKPAPKTPSAPAKGGVRITYGENTNASAMDRAATDASRAKLAKKAPSAKASAKASVGVSASSSGSVAPKKAKPAPSYAERRTAMEVVQKSYRAEKKAAEAPAARKATTPAATPKKPASEAPKPVQKPSYKKGPASGEMAYKAPKFSGNWQGAAATDMQKRGGARINRGGGLLGKLRKK